jgi:murein DD-endopeptidase MepM/ murein hydrolase activator NlpD
MRRLFLLMALLILAAGSPLRAQTVTRRVGSVTVTVDQSLAYPGGLFVVRLQSRRALGSVVASFDGMRCPFFWTHKGLRALVPIRPTIPGGSTTVGIELQARRGRQRIGVPASIATREYPARSVALPDDKLALLAQPGAVRQSRELLLALRGVSAEQSWRGPFKPPVDADPVYGYGAPTRYAGAANLEAATDAIAGEYHRGMDYPVPAGTVVQAPGAGRVALAGPQIVTGNTLVLDHGQGVFSVFFHLGRIDVREGDLVEGRAPIALSGDSGILAAPHVHWAVYVHGVAVDPRVMERLAD